MAVSRVCYVSRETLIQASIVQDDEQNTRVDRVNQTVARKFEADSRTWFVPRAAVRTVTLPLVPDCFRTSYGLWVSIALPAHLQSASSIVLHTSDTTAITLALSQQYRLSPDSPPYDHVELVADQVDPVYGIDVVTGWWDFRPYLTVTGIWSHNFGLVGAGTLAGALSDTALSLTCSDGTLIGVGDSLLIGSEQILVADRIQTTELAILRAQGGTTAANHSNSAPIQRYQPPEDVQNANIAKAISTIQQELAGYGRTVGTGEGQRPYSGKSVSDEWACDLRIYRRGWVIA